MLTTVAGETFTIAENHARALLCLTLRGFWTADTMPRFTAALVPAIGRMRARHQHYDIVADLCTFPVQSGPVGEAFAGLLKSGATRTRGRTALVVGGALARLQALRVFSGTNIGIFLSMEEALTWLATSPADSSTTEP